MLYHTYCYFSLGADTYIQTENRLTDDTGVIISDRVFCFPIYQPLCLLAYSLIHVQDTSLW